MPVCTGQQTLLSGLLLSRNVLPVKVSVSIVWQMIDTTFLKCPQILSPPSIAHWFNLKVENVLKHVRFASAIVLCDTQGALGMFVPAQWVCPVFTEAIRVLEISHPLFVSRQFIWETSFSLLKTSLLSAYWKPPQRRDIICYGKSQQRKRINIFYSLRSQREIRNN